MELEHRPDSCADTPHGGVSNGVSNGKPPRSPLRASGGSLPDASRQHVAFSPEPAPLAADSNGSLPHLGNGSVPAAADDKTSSHYHEMLLAGGNDKRRAGSAKRLAESLSRADSSSQELRVLFNKMKQAK